MVREILKIRTDNGLGANNPTFKDIEITEYSYKSSRMGMPELTATLKWATCLDDEWSGKEYVILRGERFYIRHTPSSGKSNTDARWTHEISFTSEFAEILGNTYFIDAVPDAKSGIEVNTANKPCTNNTTFTFYGTIREFVDRLNCAFLYAGIGDSILNTKTSLTTNDTVTGDGYCAMVDPYGDYDVNKSYEFSWEDKKLWEAITESYNITEIPFEHRGRKIIFGAVPSVVDHKFEYGFDNELLSVNHKNANAQVINRTAMLGSSENIPYYYPNETEYGHISIAEKEGNNTLTASMLDIANMTQLLSRLNADSFAVLGKYDGTDTSDAKTQIVGYSTSFGDNTFALYPLNTYLKHEGVGTARVIPWHIKVQFNVTEAGIVVCKDIMGNIWRQNDTPPADGINLVENVTPEKLMTAENLQQGLLSMDISSQVEKQEDAISLGYLKKGEYTFQFSIAVPNRGGAGTNPVTAFCVLNSISIAAASKKKTGYYWQVGDKKYDGVGSLGVKMLQPVTDAMIGDGFGWVASGRMPFQDRLVSPKYRETLGAERFYNALNDTYIDPDTNAPYVFPNPFIEGAPSEHIFRDDKRKPTIEGVTNAVQRKDVNGALMFDDNGNPIYQLLGEIADIAYDENDNDILKPDSTEDNDKNDSLKYEHSFFYIKLNIFNGDYGFDLFAHASQTDPMTLQMTSGNCNGCKFKIQALEYEDETGLKSYKNPVQTSVVDGSIVAGGYDDKVKADWQEWQQNTQTHSIWICVQKDAETFGVLMPNQSNNFKPKIGDTFNITNIVMPLTYWYAAEKRLEEDGIRYMADNNEEKFTFDIQASRIFFAKHPEVLAQLDEYSKIKVKYNGKIYEQYVNQLTIDCKDNEVLPNIGIDLTDTLAVGQSFVEQVAERASSLIANATTMGGYLGGTGGGLSATLADNRYLNKQKADRTPYKLSSSTGFEVGEFVSGGSGGIFFIDPETGQTYIEADKLKVRMKAIFEELEISKATSIGGKQIITPGGSITISFVEELEDSYRCYFKAKEESKGADCLFVVGDQVQCWEGNITDGTTQDASNQYYWRLVTAVNNDESYIELSMEDCDENSDAPQAGDTIVQLGNRQNTKRQSAIILSTVDAFAPCVTLYNGINHYSLDGNAVIAYGVDKTQNPPEPFFNCYGRMFVGPRDRSSYLDFRPADNTLEFKGIINAQTKVGDTLIEQYIKNVVPLDDYEYLKKALGQDTTIAGGLIMSSLISMGVIDNNGVRQTWAGMNGIYSHGKTIASWWGGPMVDKYYNGTAARPTPLATGYAQSLVRMDGSGYFAGGNIRWNEYGSMTFGSGITIDLGDGKSDTLGGIGNSLASLTLLFNKLSDALVPIILVNNIPTVTNWGNITSVNDLYAIKSVKSFYTDGFLSAKGLNPDGGSGGGSGGATQLRMLTDVLITDSSLAAGQALVYNGSKWVNQAVATGLDTTQLAAYLTANGYATQAWVEDKGYLTAVAWGEVTGKPSWIGASKPGYDFSEIGSKPTTIAGYGITDAKIAGGVITLGNNSITPLVSHQTIYALTFQSGTFSAKTYTPNSAAQTVNIPTTTTHISEGTRLYFTDGRAQAALAGHTGDADIHITAAERTAWNGKLDASVYNTFKSGYDAWKATVDAFKTLFDSMFVKESDGQGGWRIKALFGLYTDEFLSARGLNSAGGGGGTGFGLMRSWPATAPANTTTDALGANLGYELHVRVATLEGDYLSKTAAAGLYQPKGNYLTAHQAIRTLTIQRNGVTVDTFNPTAAANKTINITDVASAETLSTHVGNSTIHITAAERTLWNNTATNLAAILGSDTDNVINKYEEIVAFLDTYTEADTLAGLLSNKADKVTQIIAGTGLTGGGTLAADRTLSLATSGVTAGTYTKLTVDAYGRATAGSNPTTLAGYGITNAYTKNESDGKYVTLATNQTITGKKSFSYTLTFINTAPNTTGWSGNANNGLIFWRGTESDPDTNMHIGVMSQAANQDGVITSRYLYLGWGAAPYSIANNFAVCADFIKYKNQDVLHTGNYATTLDTRYLQKSVFEDLFEKVNVGTSAAPVWAIKAKYGFYSVGFVSAHGLNGAGSGSGGSGFGLMRDWPAADPGESTTDALGANLGWGLRTDLSALTGRVSALEGGSVLTVTTTGSGNAVTAVSKSGTAVTVTKGATFLTSHQALDYINVKDIRSTTPAPSEFADGKVTAWFNNSDKPSSLSTWYSGITVNGWASATYAVWQLAANSTNSIADRDLYFRVGRASTWEDWQKILTSANTYISGGVITINGTSITPLTSHQSLANYVDKTSAQDIAGKKTFTNGLKVSGRFGGTDDEGIIIGRASNNYAGLILGDPSGVRSIFYLNPSDDAFWRFNDGTTSYNILHPKKSGTIALTSQLTDGSVTKLGTSTVGSAVNPIYLSAGVPTACSYAFGNASGNVPVSNGTVNTNLNADKLDGLHASSFYATKHLFDKGDYQHYVVLLWKANANGIHRINGKLYTQSSGSIRYQAANIDMWFSRWGTGTNFDQNLRLDTFGLGTKWKLVTCTYNGESWYALQHTNTQGIAAYFVGVSLDIDFTAVHYYTSNPATAVNSSINDSIVDQTSLLAKPYIGSNAYALVSDTVAAANKLATARTLWGQSFDGSGNVSGNMTGVGNITGSGAIVMHANGVLTLNGTGGVYIRHNGTDSKSLVLNGASFKPFDAANNSLTLGSSSARWSNTYSVLGNFSGLLTASAGIKIGEATIVYDSATGMLHSDKGFYSDGAVSARGVSATGGSGSSGGGTSYNRLDAWADYSADKSGWVLSAALGQDLNSRLQNVYSKTTIDGMLANYVTLGTVQPIEGVKTFNLGTWVLKGNENNEITNRQMARYTWGADGDTYKSITHGIDFRWYDSHWVIGSIRGGNTASDGFGIGELNANGNLNAALRITKDKLYAGGYATLSGTSAQFLKADGSVDTNSYALSSALGNYLPLTGGVIKSGASTNPLSLSTTNANGVYINFNIGSDAKSCVGYIPTYGAYIYNYASGKYLGIKDDGTPHFQGNTIWHSGNDGAGSGLDADMVDGVHGSDLRTKWTAYAGGSYTGWIKIVQWDLTTAGYFSPANFILQVYRGYNSPSPETYTISASFGWGAANMVQMNGHGMRIIEKFRITRSTDSLHYYLEMYVNTAYSTYQNNVTLYLFGYSSFNGVTKNELQTASVTEVCSVTTKVDSIVGSLEGNAATATNADMLDGKHANNFIYYDTNASANLCQFMGYAYSSTNAIWRQAGPALGFGVGNYHTLFHASTSTNSLYIKSCYNGTYSNWREFAFLDSNVASATNADKLDGKHDGEVTAKKLTVTEPTTVGVTVATAKTNMLNAVKGNVFGNVAKVGANLIDNWGTDSATTVASATYSVINVTPQYDGDSYGQYLLFRYGSFNPKVVGRDNGAWTMRTLAFTSDNVASASRLATTGTFSAWGQTFFANGVPQSVSGAISNAGNITPAVTHASTLGSASLVWEYIYGRYFTTDAGYDMRLCTGGTERIHVNNSDGKVGFGTTAPAYAVDVAGGIGVTDSIVSTLSSNTYIEANCGRAIINSKGTGYVMLAKMNSTNGVFTFGSYNNNFRLNYTSKATLDANKNEVTHKVILLNEDGATNLHELVMGMCSVKWDADNNGLHFNRGIYSDAYITAKGAPSSSDMRLKDVLFDVKLDVDVIAKAPSFVFDWKDGAGTAMGSSAQYWREHTPWAVRSGAGGYLSMEYGNIALAASIANSREIVALKDEIKQLKAEIKKLKSEKH